jgi:hypothetical protein
MTKINEQTGNRYSLTDISTSNGYTAQIYIEVITPIDGEATALIIIYSADISEVAAQFDEEKLVITDCSCLEDAVAEISEWLEELKISWDWDY